MRRRLRVAVGATAAAALTVAAWWLLPSRFDLIVSDGVVVDGTLAEPTRRTVCVNKATIKPCPSFRRVVGAVHISAAGMIVAPGFVDVHTHVEQNVPERGSAPLRAQNFITQGVTTIVTGNCGTSVIDIAALRERLASYGSQVNVATLIGHNTLRSRVLGREGARAATGDEVERMRALVKRAMDNGALGFSTGLAYPTASFADSRETVALAQVTGSANGIFAAHIRNEGVAGVAALDEALDVMRRANVRGHVCHLKAAGKSQWGSMAARLRKVESVPRVSVDVYPYDASSTDLSPLVPPSFYKRRIAEWKRLLRLPTERAKLQAEMSAILARAGWTDYAFVQVASFWPDKRWDGAYIPAIAKARLGHDASLREQQDVIIEFALRGGAQMIYHEMSETDVDRVVLWPGTVIGSDASAKSTDIDAHPHPRGFGTFPRVVANYVLRNKLTLQEAVRRMTSLPAEDFGLGNRGRIADGYRADLTIFSLRSTRDRATYEEPLQVADGIRDVIVNGVPVVRDGKETRSFPGRFVAMDRSHPADQRAGKSQVARKPKEPSAF